MNIGTLNANCCMHHNHATADDKCLGMGSLLSLINNGKDITLQDRCVGKCCLLDTATKKEIADGLKMCLINVCFN